MTQLSEEKKLLGSFNYLATGVKLEINKEDGKISFHGKRTDDFNKEHEIKHEYSIYGFKKDSLLILAQKIEHKSLDCGNEFRNMFYIIENDKIVSSFCITDNDYQDSFDVKKVRYNDVKKASNHVVELLTKLFYYRPFDDVIDFVNDFDNVLEEKIARRLEFVHKN